MPPAVWPFTAEIWNCGCCKTLLIQVVYTLRKVTTSSSYCICHCLFNVITTCHRLVKKKSFKGVVKYKMPLKAAHSELTGEAALVPTSLHSPTPLSPAGDIFNLIKACQRYWFWHFQLWLSPLWAPWAVDLLICDEGALSVRDHMDEEPLCLPYGPVLSAGDTDVWPLPRSHYPPATHN